jgi:hypothetical protein
MSDLDGHEKYMHSIGLNPDALYEEFGEEDN